MLTTDYSPQYKVPCVLIAGADPHTAGEIIEFARLIGAVYEDEPDSLCYVVQFPGRPQELYTDAAIRRSQKG